MVACEPCGAEGHLPGGHEGGSNSVVESQPSKLLVAGSIPVSRSKVVLTWPGCGDLALARLRVQSLECRLAQTGFAAE